MTMANGVSFTPLQISQLPDDPEKPMYLFDSEQWDKAPKVFVMEMDENTSHPTRTSKNDKYKDNGNALMWNRYVAFGYYHTKNIYDFIEKWESASDSIVDVCKMVWREYPVISFIKLVQQILNSWCGPSTSPSRSYSTTIPITIWQAFSTLKRQQTQNSHPT